MKLVRRLLGGCLEPRFRAALAFRLCLWAGRAVSILRSMTALAVCAGALGMLGGLASCAQTENYVEPPTPITPREEAKIGERLQEEVGRQFQLVADADLVGYVRGVGSRIAAASPEKSELRPEFFVVNDPTPNAFSLPGGAIYVNTGLIHAAGDEAEIAGVLAHQYGHIVYRHDAAQLGQRTGAELIRRLAGGDRSPATMQVIASIVGNVGSATFTRDDEAEADQVAVPAMVRAGYNPAAIVSFPQTLRTRGADVEGPNSYFAAHAVTQERAARVQAYVGSLSGAELTRPTADLRRARERIDQLGLAKRGPER